MPIKPSKKRRKRAPVVHNSTGNVFADLGLPDADALLAKAELIIVIRDLIERRNLTQTEAAAVLGVTQPDVSDLVRGKLERFSMERLERFLNALDFDVRIRVGPRPRGKKRADITVEVVSSF
jgi:predicted XRE-type DNA-binding protein